MGARHVPPLARGCPAAGDRAGVSGAGERVRRGVSSGGARRPRRVQPEQPPAPAEGMPCGGANGQQGNPGAVATYFLLAGT